MNHTNEMISDIPKRKPRDYPKDFRKWQWIGDEMRVHAYSKRVWKKKIPTYVKRTDRGRERVWSLLKKRYPWAFTKFL